MDPQIFALIEPIIILTFLSGLAVGVKHMIWGKGPLRRVKGGENVSGLEQRVTELEDLLEQQHVELLDRQADLEERLEFAERMLTQRRQQQLDSPPEPRVATPK